MARVTKAAWAAGRAAPWSIVLCAAAVTHSASAAYADPVNSGSQLSRFADWQTNRRGRVDDPGGPGVDARLSSSAPRSLLARTFERAAIGDRPTFSGQCAGADRASISQSQMRFRERTARAADQAAVTAATLADSQSLTSNAGLSVPGLQACTGSLEVESDSPDFLAGGHLKLTGEANVIEDRTARGLEAERDNDQVFGMLSAEYALPSVALGPLSYSSGVGLDATHSRNEGGSLASSRQNSISAKHGLSWSSRTGNASLLSLGVSQTATRVFGAEAAPETSLAQSLRASWSRFASASSRTLLSASFTATRTLAQSAQREASSKSMQLLARHDQLLSPNSRLSIHANVLASDRRARAILDESVLSALKANPFQSTGVSLRSAGASYQRSTSLGGARVDFSLGINALRNEVSVDSLGLFASRFARTLRSVDAGLDYAAGNQGLRLTTRARIAESGGFSMVLQISKSL